MNGIINLYDYRHKDEPTWELPPWNHVLGQGIMPLLIQSAGYLRPIGTAFLLGKFGIVATAAHCVKEALPEPLKREFHLLTGVHELKEAGLSVLHYRVNGSRVNVTIWPLEHIQVLQPSDLVVGSLQWTSEAESLTFTFSPAVPRVGSELLTIGYCRFKYPGEGIPIAAVRGNAFNWLRDYAHTLRVSSGKVLAIFSQRWCDSFLPAPCVLSSANAEPGQSGGPVFNDSGCICAAHSASSYDREGRAASVCSVLFPALSADITATLHLGDKCHFKVTTPLISLMRTGVVQSDGSETRLRFTKTDSGIRVDPFIVKEDLPYVFQDRHGYLAARPARPVRLD
jgi:hypothetical protein